MRFLESSPERLFDNHFQHLRKVYDSSLSELGYEKLVVHSGGIRTKFQDDLPCDYIPNKVFEALVPLSNAPDSWIIWQQDKRPVILLYQPLDYWHITPSLPNGYWSEFYDIQLIRSPSDVSQYLNISDSVSTAFLGDPDFVDVDDTQWDINPVPLLSRLDWHRSFKTEYEQWCIFKANVISAGGHEAARVAFENGLSEFEISLAFQSACKLTESELPYTSIICLNEHSSVLHYYARDKEKPKDKRSFLIDAGARFNGYASDVTRTYSTKPSLFRDMVVELDTAQQRMVDLIQVGKRYSESSLEALRCVAEILKNSGVLNIDSDLAIESGVINTFMPHGLGHFLGLRVHDVGNLQSDITGKPVQPDPQYPNMRLMRTAEENQVVTVEPGIYFIKMLLQELRGGKYSSSVNWEVIESLIPYGGMRIEDNILVCEKNNINLTRNAIMRFLNN